MTVNDFLLDFAIASLFIMVGQLIRAKVGLVQKFFVPASMIAGFIALALGNQGLNILPFSGSIGDYPGALIILIFAAVGMNGFSFSKKEFKSELDRVGSYFSYKVLAQAIQFAFAPLFGVLVISRLFPEINYGFGFLLASGFSGGHGTAAAVGSKMADKIGTKRGWTKYIESFQYISGDLKTGLIRDEDKRGSMGRETVASVVLDPLAWHLALLLVASGAGFLANGWIKNATGLDLPSYLLAFIIAIVMFLCFQKTGVGHYIDNTVISRISGTATDYLVFFGIASIKISVIVEYAVPLLMLLVFGMVLVVLTLMYFGPAMNKGSWFERSLFVWGYSTGVFAIGFILLRIVDPENKSKTLNDTALTGPLTTPFEMFAWSMAPGMLLHGQHWQFIGLYLVIFAACIVVNLIFKWWWIKLPLNRPAEGELK